MGKRRVILTADNEELRETIEYLLASSGYFEILTHKEKSGENETITTIDVKTFDVLSVPFSNFIGDLIEKLEITYPVKESLADNSNIRVLTIGCIREGFRSSEFAFKIARILFLNGHRPAYLSLKSINTNMPWCENNETGFARWLMDSKNEKMGPAEKYIYDTGEMILVGVPRFNPNAGDVKESDIKRLIDVLVPAGVDFLIIDIGVSLDLEREKILLSTDLPIIIMNDGEQDEIILHRYFEGAIPLKNDITQESLIVKLFDRIES